jgi:tetratricopeptide (TPR) repeat protein
MPEAERDIARRRMTAERERRRPRTEDDPALARWSSIESRRAAEGLTSPEEYPSAVRAREAREAAAAADPEMGRETIAELRERLAEEAAKETPVLPADDEIAAAWFSAGFPPAERRLSSSRLAADSGFYLERAQALIADGRLDDARVALQEALQRDPNNASALVELGTVYDRLGDATRAREQYEAALAIAPDTARGHYRLGNSLLVEAFGRKWNEGFEMAISSYDRALTLDPDYTFALNNKGFALIELGRTQEARSALLAAIRLDSGYSAPYRNLGIIAERHDGDLVRALSYYKEYLALNGPDRINVESWVREIERQLAGL